MAHPCPTDRVAFYASSLAGFVFVPVAHLAAPLTQAAIPLMFLFGHLTRGAATATFAADPIMRFVSYISLRIATAALARLPFVLVL